LETSTNVVDLKKHQQLRARRHRAALYDFCLRMVEDIPCDCEDLYGESPETIARACVAVLCDNNDDNPETTAWREPLTDFEDRELETIIEAVCRDFLDGAKPYTVHDAIKRDVVATHRNCWIKARRFIVDNLRPRRN
jgi:hypothetical protein